MGKAYHIFLTALFSALLGFFLLWHLLLPDQTFSPTENRYLETLPTPDFTLPEFFGGSAGGNVFTGDFMADFERYVNDQFPLRDGWVGLKARMELLSGKGENNGVYFGTDGRFLLAHYPKPDGERVEKNLGYVNRLGEALEIPVYFSLIPGKSHVYPSYLPKGAPVGDQGDILTLAAQTPEVTWVELAGKRYGDWSPDLDYYFTDHHWTSRGAYHGYHALMEGMGRQGVEAAVFTAVTDSFYGTTWSKAGAYWYPPDTMEIAVSPEDVTVTNYFDTQPTAGELYRYEKLEEKDKYPFFLGGNQPLCVVESSKPGAEGNLLLVRDSFSDTLAPFLTQNFAQIHLMDLRYYKTSVARYAEEHDIDQVLVLYSVDNFVTDANLFPMGM